MDQLRYIRVDTQDGLGIVTLDNPPSNFLSRGLVNDLSAVFQSFSAEKVKAIVLTGSGRVFSAGADPNEIAEIEADDEAKEIASAGQGILSQLEGLKKPIVAAINGLCLGGGLELAMACHLRFCSQKARLGLPEVTLGLIPGLGGTQRLPRLIGVPRALDLILTGDTIKADKALEMGLVDRVMPAESLLSGALDYARRLSRRDSAVIAAALTCITDGVKLSLDDGLKLEIEMFSRLCGSGEKAKFMKHLIS